MDNASRIHVAQTDQIPVGKVLGAIVLCFALMASVLFLGVQMILRAGKKEHEDKIRRAHARVTVAKKEHEDKIRRAHARVSVAKKED
ncbi:hypothetical protein BGZ94_001358 [Podila epigama]|nr:hypothetical protein BGZ94_001358 [Podila epigama]